METLFVELEEVLGLEPRMTESKSVVLPLHYTSIVWWPSVESDHLIRYVVAF